MRLPGLSSSVACPPLADRFVSLSVGNTLVLKACGFIEDYRARILDVSETSLRVAIGEQWFRSLLTGRRSKKPVEVSLIISPFDPQIDAHLERYRRAPESYCLIDVSIRATSPRWSPAEFDLESKRILWALRSYFMAC